MLLIDNATTGKQMAIINMWSDYLTNRGETGRVDPELYTPWFADNSEAHSYAYNGGTLSRDNHVTIYKSHVGLCLADREYNGYEDSDWFMAVWDEHTQSVKEVCFASTRGWTYPCYGSKPDATPEVRALAQAYFDRKAAAARKQRRHEVARELRAVRLEEREVAALAAAPVMRVRELRRIMGDDYAACVTLLKTKKFRSTFRESMARQIKEWLTDQNPKFPSPLSPRQRQYI